MSGPREFSFGSQIGLRVKGISYIAFKEWLAEILLNTDDDFVEQSCFTMWAI